MLLGLPFHAQLSSAGEFAPPEPNPWASYQDYGHSHWHDSLIVADGASNVTITGPGILDGGPNMAENQPAVTGVGCRLIALRSARSVTLSQFSTQRTGWFALLATNVTGLHVADTVWDVTRDGLDIVGCQDVVIENTSVSGGGDDAIVLKSDWSLGAQLDSRNITVRDCTVGSWGNNAMQIGSETVGDFTGILWQRVNVIYAGQSGIGMVSMDGGHIHGVIYEDIMMVQAAIPISMYIGARQARHPRPFRVGSISGITIRNTTASDCYSDRHGPASWAATLDGQPADPRYNVTSNHPVGPGIRLDNVDLSACFRGGGNASERSLEPDHAKGEAYPAPGFLGPRPSHGLYVRHATGVDIVDISLGWGQGNVSAPCCRPDERAAVIVEESSKIVFNRLHAKRDAGPAGPGHDVGLRKGAHAGTTVTGSAGIIVRNISSSGAGAVNRWSPTWAMNESTIVFPV